ncbi:MAG: hypothetical protein LBD65_06415 [Spirochaetaceae bacterium]|nr:hypothetical protein [Spirochaetaceae bacterium]
MPPDEAASRIPLVIVTGVDKGGVDGRYREDRQRRVNKRLIYRKRWICLWGSNPPRGKMI